MQRIAAHYIGLGKLSLQYILKVCKVKFYFHLLYAANSLLSDIFLLHYGDCYSADDCLRCVPGPRHVAVNAVYELFGVDSVIAAYVVLFNLKKYSCLLF